MKTQSHTTLIVRSSLALVLALSIWSPVQMHAAEPEPSAGRMMKDGKMSDQCQAMQEQRAKTMTEIKAQDAELTAQVAAMNKAPDNKKVALLAAVVTSLVEQRTAMHARMEEMQQEMMPHMAQHMQMGAESMSQCPMMSGMAKKTGTAPHAPK